MFKVLILICALNVPHEQCSEKTASDVIKMPDTVNSCGMEAMAFLAKVGSLLDDEQQYAMIACDRFS